MAYDYHPKIERAIRECNESGLGASLAPAHRMLRDMTPYLRISTKASRDPSRRDNGGEYDFWTTMRVEGDQVVARDCCSCDFWQPEDEWSSVAPATEFAAIVAAVAAAVPRFENHFESAA